MPKRTTRTIPRLRSTILRVTELERRDTPAWWSVAAPVPAEGTVGVTDATHAGSLALNPNSEATNGAATVWADTAALAVAKALAGTMSVTLSGQTVEHAFGPATVGATAADHKAYLAVVTGTSVALAFEDMAGQPGCDYDYNDRSWSGVTVASTGDPVVPFDGPDNWLWHNPPYQEAGNVDETATVELRVTRPDPDTFRWQYTLTNHSLSVLFSSPGINNFQVTPEDASLVTKMTTSMAGWEMDSSGGGVSWWMKCLSTGPYLPIGDTATFGFDTPPVPITAAYGGVGVAGVGGGGENSMAHAVEGDGDEMAASSMNGPTHCASIDNGAGGPAKGPGIAFADITIDGDLTVGATNPDIPGSKPVVTEFSPKNNTNEDTIGGLVVRNPNNIADNNVVPRQQITIQKLKDAAGNPAVGGQVTLTVPGEVKLFDAASKGNLVATGRVFDQKALPKTLWVEGAVGSSTMRDAKIKAVPAGNAAGADDVSFTVLWVDVTVALAGTISADNSKKAGYQGWTVANNLDLKLQRYNATFGARMGWGSEARGKVSPADFNYPGSDLMLDRSVEFKDYENGVVTAQRAFGPNYVPGNDNGPAGAHDNDPTDSAGYIYDWDAPGLSVSSAILNTIRRTRNNFQALATIAVNGTRVRPSGVYAYYVRFSMKQTGAGNTDQWQIISDIAGDNAATGPAVTKLSVNLT